MINFCQPSNRRDLSRSRQTLRSIKHQNSRNNSWWANKSEKELMLQSGLQSTSPTIRRSRLKFTKRRRLKKSKGESQSEGKLKSYKK